MVVNLNYVSAGQPMAPIEKASFPVGITKLGPRYFFIKARVKVRSDDPREPVDDRRAQRHFEGSQAEAEEKYLAMKAELRGDRPDADTFGVLLENYQESRGGEIPRSERSIYEALVRDLGGLSTESRQLENGIQRYGKILAKMPSKTTGKLLSGATRNRYRAMIAAALNLAIELKDIPGPSVMTKAIWPKMKEIPRDRRLTPDETSRIMAVVREHRPHLEMIFWYALRVPCRKEELVDAQKPQLDLFNNMIRMENGETKNDDGCWKPIPEEMIPYFRTLPPDCPYLFYRRGLGKLAGKFLKLGDFKKAWRWVLRKAGITNFRFHDTRHIAATNLVNAGMSERDVMRIAGWNTNMLSTYWGSLSRESAARAKFLPGNALLNGGNPGATLGQVVERSAVIEAERAVS